MLRSAQTISKALPSVPGRAADEKGTHRFGPRLGSVAGETGHVRSRHHRLAGEAVGAPPPAVALHDRVARFEARRELGDQRGQCRLPRRPRPHVERARLVVAVAFGQQGVPVERAEQRPGGDGHDLRAGPSGAMRGAPDLEQPAHLVFAPGVDVRFGDRDRDAVALPGLLEQRTDARPGDGENAHRFDVDERVRRRPAPRMHREALQTMVQPAVAGHVVVDAEHVWAGTGCRRTRAGRQAPRRCRRDRSTTDGRP